MSEQSSDPRRRRLRGIRYPPAFAQSSARFADRRDAGRQLADLLGGLEAQRPVVVAIPRGGVPVAAEVARALEAPLDVTVVCKIGAPRNREYAIGALAEGGVHVLSERAVRSLGVSQADLGLLLERAHAELSERLERWRGSREPVDLRGRTVILVDDGLATGRSAMAAVASLRKRDAARVILAVPVAAPESAAAMRREADEVVCVKMPPDLWAVGVWYEDFSATTDREVAALLSQSTLSPSPVSATEDSTTLELAIPAAVKLELPGELAVPPGARGVVVFAHGSGSSRLSPRNLRVALALQRAGYATLLFDLLTAVEEANHANAFDIPLLSARLEAATVFLRKEALIASLPVAYFGASTGAAAALTAAGRLREAVGAVVSRGGRADLAPNLADVRAPTLLIVGGSDGQVRELNRRAQRELRCPSKLAIVPGATHLFAEAGALERVSRLTIDWLDRYLPRP